jgi:hypothetical protein
VILICKPTESNQSKMDKVTFNENTFVSFLFTRHNVNAISISDISDSMIGGDKLIHPAK